MSFVAGTVGKYMIDNVEIPKSAYPTSVVPSHNLVSKSWNNMYGEFIDIPVNSKLKVNWVFDCISSADALTIMGKILNKIRGITTPGTYSRFFTINTYFPGLGWISSEFYLGTPTTFNSIGSGSKTVNGNGAPGDPDWWKMELHWIETKGEKLYSPSYTPSNVLSVNNRQIEVVTPEELEEALNQQR